MLKNAKVLRCVIFVLYDALLVKVIQIIFDESDREVSSLEKR